MRTRGLEPNPAGIRDWARKPVGTGEWTKGGISDGDTKPLSSINYETKPLDPRDSDMKAINSEIVAVIHSTSVNGTPDLWATRIRCQTPKTAALTKGDGGLGSLNQ